MTYIENKPIFAAQPAITQRDPLEEIARGLLREIGENPDCSGRRIGPGRPGGTWCPAT